MNSNDKILRDTITSWKEIFQFANDNGLEIYDDNTYIYFRAPHVDTEEEIRIKNIEAEISNLKQWLASHDYIGIKIATGRAAVEEYASEIAEMKVKAERINELEAELASLNASTE